jgi:cell division septation protein DedD
MGDQMIKSFLAIFLIVALAVFFGCDKSKEDVDKLEQEAMEVTETVSDSLTIEEESDVTETLEETVSAEDDLASRRYEATGTGGFTVQIGSGTSRRDANYTAEQFIGRGYEAFVSEVYIDDVSYFRIRIGNFETYEEARQLGEDLKDKYTVDYWIDNNI